MKRECRQILGLRSFIPRVNEITRHSSQVGCHNKTALVISTKMVVMVTVEFSDNLILNSDLEQEGEDPGINDKASDIVASSPKTKGPREKGKGKNKGPLIEPSGTCLTASMGE